VENGTYWAAARLLEAAKNNADMSSFKVTRDLLNRKTTEQAETSSGHDDENEQM